MYVGLKIQFKKNTFILIKIIILYSSYTTQRNEPGLKALTFLVSQPSTFGVAPARTIFFRNLLRLQRT